MENFRNGAVDAFQGVIAQIVGIVPKVLGLLGFILIAWIIIKISLFIINKLLVKVQVDKWGEKLKDVKIFGNTTINVMLSKVILGIIKWFLILIFLMIGASVFGITVISNGIEAFFAFLPRLLTAIVIFSAGVYLGTLVKQTIISMFKSFDIGGGKLAGNILFYVIVIFTSITALDQAGIDTSIIKQNVTLIMGSILLAFTIAFGLGARDAVSRLLYGYYSRKNIGVGSKVKIDNVIGVVLEIDNICLTISTNQGKIVYPIKYIVDNEIQILN